MKFRVLIASILFVCCLLPDIGIAQNKVVVIPMGSGSTGNASEADVLRGKTFSNQSATGLIGTRPSSPVPEMTSVAADSWGVTWPNPRFTGGVAGYTDQLTSLHWIIPDNSPLTWLTAVNHCYGLSTGVPPHVINDWRMPTLREIHSLVDYSVENPALPNGHPFGTIINGPYWSSIVIGV